MAVGVALSGFTIVSAGHTGVVSTFGQVSETVLQEGFHFKAPWQKVTEMDNRIVKLKVSTAAFILDLQTVTVNLAVNYRVAPSKSFSIVKNVGTKDEDVLITPAVNEVMKAKATGT
ncbi:SPFH domain-containing protein [Acutalibacter sp. JLR.KK004]|uniref:SPFH domain-containing protein n=1 Tax=Acutalibacter sp. JLR.KK004 TaxID=3112622 RepID=UPI002FF2D1B7